MTPEQKAKYEEAAKAKYPRWFQDFEEGIKRSAFLAGASFAEKENEKHQNAAEVLARGLKSRDAEIEQLQETLKEVVKRSLQALNDVYEECHCEEQNLPKRAGKYSDKVREYKEKSPVAKMECPYNSRR